MSQEDNTRSVGCFWVRALCFDFRIPGVNRLVKSFEGITFDIREAAKLPVSSLGSVPCLYMAGMGVSM